MQKVIYTSPSFTATEMRTKDGFYRTKGAGKTPRLLELILRQVVHPMPGDSEISQSKPTLQEHSFGKTKLDCIMTVPTAIRDANAQPLGLSPTYCFDHDQDLLRLSYDFISQATVRTRVGAFLGHNVVVDQTSTLVSVNEVSARLEALITVPLDEATFVATSELEKLPDRIGASSTVTAGSCLTKIPPIYPDSAKFRHISGHVVMSVIIGMDGHVRSATVISSPDESLSNAAVAAVKQWIYQPFLLNGRPVEVDTIITSNFIISP
jgi:TonB family protein